MIDWVTSGLVLLGYLMGHTIAQAKARDFYHVHTGAAALWTVGRLCELLRNEGFVDAKELVRFLGTLSHDISSRHIEFHSGRTLRAPGTVSVEGKSHGPITR